MIFQSTAFLLALVAFIRAETTIPSPGPIGPSPSVIPPGQNPLPGPLDPNGNPGLPNGPVGPPAPIYGPSHSYGPSGPGQSYLPHPVAPGNFYGPGNPGGPFGPAPPHFGSAGPHIGPVGPGRPFGYGGPIGPAGPVGPIPQPFGPNGRYPGNRYPDNQYYNQGYVPGPHVPILSYSNVQNPLDGSYHYGYATADGKQAEETGYLKNAFINNQGEPVGTQVVQGSYSYTSPDGTPIQVSYVADENGFRPSGVHIPSTGQVIPPPVFNKDDPSRFNGFDRYNPYPYNNNRYPYNNGYPHHGNQYNAGYNPFHNRGYQYNNQQTYPYNNQPYGPSAYNQQAFAQSSVKPVEIKANSKDVEKA